MKTLRNLALAGTVAIAAALSSGAANAAPATALEIGIPGVTGESAITQAYHGHHGGRRLCYVPFFKLVQWFGYWQARSIKYRCYSYNYNYYNYKSY
jgi:hypothetical protein